MARSALDLRPERLQVQFPEYGPMTNLNHGHRRGRERLPVRSPEYGPMIELNRTHCDLWRRREGLEYVEDQISADIGGVVQASKPDLKARGVVVDLL